MAVLQKLRGWGLVLSILVAIPLLLFIIDPSQVEAALQSMSSKYDVGVINGKKISYTDFQADVEKFTKISEIMRGSSASSEEQQAQIRDAAWQSLVDKYLFIKNANAAGINVGNAEMVDLTTGDNISPMIAQNPAFAGEDGKFSKDKLVEFVKNVDTNEDLKTYWNYVQNAIYTNQYYVKYNSLFTQSDFLDPLTLKNDIAENNTITNVDFVMVPLGYDTDSTIVVSSSEIKSFYSKHKDQFKQKGARDIEYVVYVVEPSQSDLTAGINDFNKAYTEFTSTDNVKSFLLKYSDAPFSEYYYHKGELKTVLDSLDNFAFGAAEGTSPVYRKGNTLYAAKIVSTVSRPDSVYVKHILLQGDNAKQVADSLLGVIEKGGNFADLAARYSIDKNSADGGVQGNIGWLTQTVMIPGFESVLTASKGVPYVVKTQYGTHVVEVEKTTAPVVKKQVAILQKEILPSKETFNSIYNQANRFASLAKGTYKGYKAAVDTLGVYSHPMNNVFESTDTYGSISGAKELTRWIFDNKPGKVSNIITVNQNNFFIAAVKADHKEGFATVAEAAPKIKEQLYQEKLAVKKAEEVKAKIAGMTDLNAIAEKLGTTVSSQTGIAFQSMTSQGLDLKFVGALSVAPVGKICGPIAGSIGTYVFKVTGRDTGAYYTEDDAKNYESQVSDYRSRILLPVMMDAANVKDHRDRFY
jgi:peptidyl-prolyl cis-trans isomerase D